MNDYDELSRCEANFQPLTPLSFLDRAARVFPGHTAIIHGEQRFTYAEFFQRSLRLASALAKRGIGRGDTVSALLLNTPPMLELHQAVPMIGAVLHSINTRVEAATVAFQLEHSESKLLFVDRALAETAEEVLRLVRKPPAVVLYDDPEFPQEGELRGAIDYEGLLADGDPGFAWTTPPDEWDAISLNYTSGTTGDPKGVVYHHRGAHLMGYANVLAAQMQRHPVYLWTLPMFHCNGWCFPWSLSVVAGTHVCLRQVRAEPIYKAIAEHRVTHLCGAPIVMSTLLNASPQQRRDIPHQVRFVTAAAPPPESVLAGMAEAGFEVTHVYGLTETYGPATVNEWHAAWDVLDAAHQAARKACQGVRYPALEGLEVMDPETLEPVPADGAAMGEVMFRGNIVMKGYLKNPEATAQAFQGGWFHSGDLGVRSPNGYIQLKDRSKDIIISGGENISSIEVENVLYKHPGVLAAAVVARPDAKWGETPCAYVELRPGALAVEQDLIEFCRDRLAHFKCPTHIVFGDLPKTSTGKVQKFKLREAARAARKAG